MPCPTCDHTMQSVGQLTTGWFLYWCPRCGTLRTTERVSAGDTGKHEITVTSKRMDDAQPPNLPGRVVKLLLACDNETVKIARRLGVIESSMPPSERTGAFQ